MGSDDFRVLGHRLVEKLADFLESLPNRPVTTGESPQQIRQALNAERTMPQQESDPGPLLDHAADLLFEHSLFNGHPRFWAYITSSAAPIGGLADLLASVVNPNVGAWPLSPMASEIEAQTIRWIAELLGYPTDCGGVLVSGGNMANMVCFLAARQAKAEGNVREQGVGQQRLRVYCSKETHTWVQKAADMSGLGTDSIRWLATDDGQRVDVAALREQLATDIASGDKPFLVIGTAGTVSTGAIDPLVEMAALCKELNLWFHVDGAYGGFAAMLPGAAPDLLQSLKLILLRWILTSGSMRRLKQAVRWCGIRNTCATLSLTIRPTITSAWKRSTTSTSVPRTRAVFVRSRYGSLSSKSGEKVMSRCSPMTSTWQKNPFVLSARILSWRHSPTPSASRRSAIVQRTSMGTTLRRSPISTNSTTNCSPACRRVVKAYISNAVIRGSFVLRACVVNFRSTLKDIEALPELVVRIGKSLDRAMRESSFATNPP